jgi:2-oxoisovalerate dehydrogenase E1 component
MQLLPQDFVSPYYRDDSILLGVGLTPYELMLQLLAKKDDPFSEVELIIHIQVCEETIFRK